MGAFDARAVGDLASCQDGVVSRRQLRELGIPAGQISRAIDRGLLRALHRGVYAVGHDAGSDRAALRAALLAGGAPTCLGHDAAWFALGLRNTLERPIAIVALDGARRRIPGLALHHPRTLDARLDTTIVGGLRCTTVPRTLLDCAWHETVEQLERRVERAEYRRLLDYDALARCLVRAGPVPGVARLRAAIGPDRLDAALVESRFERRYLQDLLEAGVQRPVLQQRFELAELGQEIRVDYCWPEVRLVGEADGPHHERPAQARKDARRDAALARMGWHVVRIPMRAHERDPVACVERVRRALAAGAPPPPLA